MRTTISLDDRLGEAARRRAADEGLSLSAFIARALAEAMARSEAPVAAPPFRLVTVGGGGPRAGIDLDRTSDILVAEDEETYRKRGR
jgi:hypothetical protein